MIIESQKTDNHLINSNQINAHHSTPPMTLSGLSWLDDAAATMGQCIIAGKGAGKSTLLAKDLIYGNWQKGHGQVVLDPLGPTIDQILDRLVRYGSQLPPEARQQLWSRVRYVEMAGIYGSVTPWPLYYRLGDESCYRVAQRYLEIVRRIDPKLTEAPIQGWNPLHELGTQAGIILSSLDGFQVTDIETMLRGVKNKNATWKQHFAEAIERYPQEATDAVDFFQNDYAKYSPTERRRIYGSLHTKLRIFSEPSFRAMFGASQPGICWQTVIDEGFLVLIDFRHVLDAERRQFLMLMVFRHFIDYIKHRGAGKHHKKVGFVVDELTTLTNQDLQSDTDIFASDLDHLINVVARNHGIMLTLALQEAWQVSERILNSLRSCGNIVQGVSSHVDSAIDAAKHLFPYDPRIIKRKQPVYAGNPPEVIDYKITQYSPQEWYHYLAQAIQQLKTFRFLVRGAKREGQFAGTIYPMSIEHLMPIVAIDNEKVAWLRQKLALRDGVPISDILDQIEARQQPVQPSVKVTAKQDRSLTQNSDTVVKDEQTDQPADHLSSQSDNRDQQDNDRDFFN